MAKAEEKQQLSAEELLAQLAMIPMDKEMADKAKAILKDRSKKIGVDPAAKVGTAVNRVLLAIQEMGKVAPEMAPEKELIETFRDDIQKHLDKLAADKWFDNALKAEKGKAGRKPGK